MLFNICPITADTFWSSVYFLFWSSSSVQVNRWASWQSSHLFHFSFFICYWYFWYFWYCCCCYLHYYYCFGIFSSSSSSSNGNNLITAIINYFISSVLYTDIHCYITIFNVIQYACSLIINIVYIVRFIDAWFIHKCIGEHTLWLNIYLCTHSSKLFLTVNERKQEMWILQPITK